MGDLNGYINEVANKSFDEFPFNEIDGVILSMASLIDVKACIPLLNEEPIGFEEVIDKHIELHGSGQMGYIISKALTRMLINAKSTERFKSLKLCDLVHKVDIKKETQSTFFSVLIPDGTRVIVCGGTDDTVIGWREDFNMIYNGHVPCLENAKKYLNKVGMHAKKIEIIGHSKGGMEALYALAYCNKRIYDKVLRAYSFDGPGYCQDIIDDEKFKNAMEKMLLFVPNGGIVGRLFNNPVKPYIIQSSYHGLNQHDPLSWEIEGLFFKKVDSFNPQSEAMINKIKKALSELTKEEAIEFIDNFFRILNAGGALTLTDAGKKPHIALIEYLKLPKPKRTMINTLIIHLVNDKIVAKELVLGVITMPRTQ